MKNFKVIYLPYGREDKEWMYVQAKSSQEAAANFKAGIVIRIEEE